MNIPQQSTKLRFECKHFAEQHPRRKTYFTCHAASIRLPSVLMIGKLCPQTRMHAQIPNNHNAAALLGRAEPKLAAAASPSNIKFIINVGRHWHRWPMKFHSANAVGPFRASYQAMQPSSTLRGHIEN